MRAYPVCLALAVALWLGLWGVGGASVSAQEATPTPTPTATVTPTATITPWPTFGISDINATLALERWPLAPLREVQTAVSMMFPVTVPVTSTVEIVFPVSKLYPTYTPVATYTPFATPADPNPGACYPCVCDEVVGGIFCWGFPWVCDVDTRVVVDVPDFDSVGFSLRLWVYSEGGPVSVIGRGCYGSWASCPSPASAVGTTSGAPGWEEVTVSTTTGGVKTWNGFAILPYTGFCDNGGRIGKVLYYDPGTGWVTWEGGGEFCQDLSARETPTAQATYTVSPQETQPPQPTRATGGWTDIGVTFTPDPDSSSFMRLLSRIIVAALFLTYLIDRIRGITHG